MPVAKNIQLPKAQRMYEMVILVTGFGEFEFSWTFWRFGNLNFPHFLTFEEFQFEFFGIFWHLWNLNLPALFDFLRIWIFPQFLVFFWNLNFPAVFDIFLEFWFKIPPLFDIFPAFFVGKIRKVKCMKIQIPRIL